jgi:hypothetical protein
MSSEYRIGKNVDKSNDNVGASHEVLSGLRKTMINLRITGL